MPAPLGIPLTCALIASVSGISGVRLILISGHSLISSTRGSEKNFRSPPKFSNGTRVTIVIAVRWPEVLGLTCCPRHTLEAQVKGDVHHALFWNELQRDREAGLGRLVVLVFGDWEPPARHQVADAAVHLGCHAAGARLHGATSFVHR